MFSTRFVSPFLAAILVLSTRAVAQTGVDAGNTVATICLAEFEGLSPRARSDIWTLRRPDVGTWWRTAQLGTIAGEEADGENVKWEMSTKPVVCGIHVWRNETEECRTLGARTGRLKVG